MHGSSAEEVAMTATANTSCFLTSVGGKFTGVGDMVQISKHEGTWYLSGVSTSGQLFGNALCVNDLVAGPDIFWQPGEAPRNLGTTAGRTCFLTAVWGNLDANGKEIRTRIEGNSWILDGNGAGGRARCVDRPSFSPMSLTPGGSAVFPFTASKSPSSPAFCALTRVSGRYRGGNARIYNYHNNDLNLQYDWRLNGILNPSSGNQPTASGRCIN
jgi:hypothetical protein